MVWSRSPKKAIPELPEASSEAKADAEQEDLVSAVKEVGKYKPGEKVKVTVKRGDKEVVIEITVGKRADFIKEKD